ncbi:hypothetical protein F1C10_12050 [Sphingomonas sp. NBWT7]|uniref:hypothetical protein n=1 Tax=Sphingomonas sp. NBWT7 TaxID=2596913 RepID=UPI00162376B9|nr:hypothetical protein [Sphingomonas sp. NBWT7]QNE32603.1 hypothetical protein F1C10_12050 [Sphingomonas sp. NBWT7]
MLAAIVAAQFTIAVSAPAPGNLSEALYAASVDASGSRLCDRRTGARYAALFNRRYGARIRALTRYHESRYGPDPDFIITTSCRITLAPARELDRNHSRAMDRFDDTLRALERRFGPTDDIR